MWQRDGEVFVLVFLSCERGNPKNQNIRDQTQTSYISKTLITEKIGRNVVIWRKCLEYSKYSDGNIDLHSNTEMQIVKFSVCCFKYNFPIWKLLLPPNHASWFTSDCTFSKMQKYFFSHNLANCTSLLYFYTIHFAFVK